MATRTSTARAEFHIKSVGTLTPSGNKDEESEPVSVSLYKSFTFEQLAPKSVIPARPTKKRFKHFLLYIIK